MTILVFIIGIGCIAIGVYMAGLNNYSLYDAAEWLTGIGVFALIASLVGLFIFGGLLIAGRDVDARIAMYEEQNAQIESQVEVAVEAYMQHENQVFDKSGSESVITLVSLYPELKSDTLISKQCDVYIANNAKICELRESKIKQQRYRFWLYFGK